MAAGVALSFTPLEHYLSFTELPALYWPLLGVTLGGFIALTQVIKMLLRPLGWI